MAHNLLRGAGSWIPIPGWYRALTTEWMPERLREEFGLNWSDADRHAAEAATQRIPHVYSRLPQSIRFVGPWHEAWARLAGHPPGPLTRLSNRFWTGEMVLPFAQK